MFGFDHCEAGHDLLRSWMLPDLFAIVAQTHHDLTQSGDPRSLTNLIGMSCRMADSAGFAAFPGCEATPYAELVNELPNTAICKLYPDFESLAAEIRGNVELMQIF